MEISKRLLGQGKALTPPPIDNPLGENLRTIIAGSRGMTDYDFASDCMSRLPWSISVVLSGTAKGADYFGEQWAIENGIEVERYPAEWEKFGRRAGMVRNAEMGDKAEALVAFWNGWSPGTRHMISYAESNGLYVWVVKYFEIQEKM